MLGAGGLLGSELVKLLPDSVAVTRTQLSVTDLPAMNGAMSHYQPEVVFNCAAYNAVDGAETEADAAYQVNAQGAFNVALACAQNEVRLIHFSTNFVFSGTLDRPYLESDEVGPLGVYGKSKLEGEKLISMVMPRAVIIRTAALFGGDGSQQRRSFPERILERASAGERIRVVSDQSINPTYAADLAAAAIALAPHVARFCPRDAGCIRCRRRGRTSSERRARRPCASPAEWLPRIVTHAGAAAMA